MRDEKKPPLRITTKLRGFSRRFVRDQSIVRLPARRIAMLSWPRFEPQRKRPDGCKEPHGQFVPLKLSEWSKRFAPLQFALSGWNKGRNSGIR